MNDFYIIILIILLSATFSEKLICQESISIQISNIEKLEGKILVALYDTAEKFLGNDVYNDASVPVKSHSMEINIPNVVPGIYAISAFHDINNNGELDSNIFGIPKEPYGFSNNVRKKFGPPDFESASFDHSTSNKKQLINLK